MLSDEQNSDSISGSSRSLTVKLKTMRVDKLRLTATPFLRSVNYICLELQLNWLINFTVSFNVGHFCRLDQCAVYILYSKIPTDPGLLKIRHSHRFVAVVIQFLIPCYKF